MAILRGKSLKDWEINAEKDYTNTPTSVIKYIIVLQEYIELLKESKKVER